MPNCRCWKPARRWRRKQGHSYKRKPQVQAAFCAVFKCKLPLVDMYLLSGPQMVTFFIQLRGQVSPWQQCEFLGAMADPLWSRALNSLASRPVAVLFFLTTHYSEDQAGCKHVILTSQASKEGGDEGRTLRWAVRRWRHARGDGGTPAFSGVGAASATPSTYSAPHGREVPPAAPVEQQLTTPIPKRPSTPTALEGREMLLATPRLKCQPSTPLKQTPGRRQVQR